MIKQKSLTPHLKLRKPKRNSLIITPPPPSLQRFLPPLNKSFTYIQQPIATPSLHIQQKRMQQQRRQEQQRKQRNERRLRRQQKKDNKKIQKKKKNKEQKVLPGQRLSLKCMDVVSYKDPNSPYPFHYVVLEPNPNKMELARITSGEIDSNKHIFIKKSEISKLKKICGWRQYSEHKV